MSIGQESYLMTADEKRVLLQQLPLDDLVYLVQMVIDKEPKWKREQKLLEFAAKK